MADLKALADAVIKGNQAESVRLTQEALDEGIGPKKVLEDGLIAGMNVIGVRFKANEVYIPEVLISGHHQKISTWQNMQSLKNTYIKRPDLLKKAKLNEEQKNILNSIKKELRQ